MVSTHIFGVSQEIDGKTFIFRIQPRDVSPLKSIISNKTNPVLKVSTHIYGVCQGHRWENMTFFRLNLGM